jgi:hypothetical protein
MKPDLTLLTGGFTGHKEIKFTNLVPLPTPVDSTRSELFFLSLTLEPSAHVETEIKKVTKATKLDLKPGTQSCTQSLSSRGEKFFRVTHTNRLTPGPRSFSGVARCLELKYSGRLVSVR